MASMVVRNIPDDVFERFKPQARAEGKSAEQLAREAIEGKDRKVATLARELGAETVLVSPDS